MWLVKALIKAGNLEVFHVVVTELRNRIYSTLKTSKMPSDAVLPFILGGVMGLANFYWKLCLVGGRRYYKLLFSRLREFGAAHCWDLERH